MGYAKKLLRQTIKIMDKPIFVISKIDKFYIKEEFLYSNEDIIGNECKECLQYKKTCFPKVMVYK